MATPSVPSASNASEGTSFFSATEVLLAEVTGVTDSLSRIQRNCFYRCCCRIADTGETKTKAHSEPNLQIWEKSCSDRCVSKHLQTHKLVGEELAKVYQESVAPPKPESPEATYTPLSFAYM
ncbi:hypothetical protein cyc_06028 [Cyclospora cayetanensis]|uniref:Mitochondrial import inner membrane translocase subunit n=1 Tax=Cyclospora cayetanensis TaxID=88456 RepID=A0A1D3CXL6_9EIME|nr:hypothetical protein cyc_06028 [Cyclospora cayetanensis]